jgi:hypothetical protein
MASACSVHFCHADASAVAGCLQEFHPYVFQILAQLIELSSPPLNAVSWHWQQGTWVAGKSQKVRRQLQSSNFQQTLLIYCVADR